MNEKYCEDWKARIEFLIPLFLKQIEDSHKSSEFLIQRSYTLLYLNAIFAFLVIQISHNPIILSCLTILMLMIIYNLRDTIGSYSHMNQGLKPTVVEIAKTYEEKDLFLDLDDGYVIHKKTSTSAFYAWVINCLDEQLQNSIKNGKVFSQSYKQALKTSLIGMIIVILLSYCIHLKTML